MQNKAANENKCGTNPLVMLSRIRCLLGIVWIPANQKENKILVAQVMVRAMLAAGARPGATDTAGRTAAQFARECAGRGVACASACADELDAHSLCRGTALRLPTGRSQK